MKLRRWFLVKRLTTRVVACGAIGVTALFLLIVQITSRQRIILNLKCHDDLEPDLTEDIQSKLSQPDCDGFHLLVFFPLASSKSAVETDSKNSKKEQLLKREKEYMETLLSNLGHPIVCKIYVFSPQPKDLQKLLVEKYSITNPNLIIHKSHPNPHYADMFRFASVNLQDKVVAILNADIQLGEGFDKFGVKWWKDHPKTMHALSRQLPKTGCNVRLIGDYCLDENAEYVGSHDMFLFYLKDPLPENFLKELCFPSVFLGSENVIIWAFRKILGFYVTNPCLILKVHHNHCSDFRAPVQNHVRVNVNGKTAMAPYTTDMVGGFFDFLFYPNKS